MSWFLIALGIVWIISFWKVITIHQHSRINLLLWIIITIFTGPLSAAVCSLTYSKPSPSIHKISNIPPTRKYDDLHLIPPTISPGSGTYVYIRKGHSLDIQKAFELPMEGNVIIIRGSKFSRSDTNKIVLHDPKVSRIQAVIKCDNGVFYFENVSKFGSYINENKIQANCAPFKLIIGDIIRMGGTNLIVTDDSQIPATIVS
jgi:hypothetical protein